MRKRTRWLLLLVVMLLTATAVGLAQGEPPVPPEPSAFWEFIGLIFNAGFVAALLQLFRRIGFLSLIPDWLRPILAGGVGIATTWLTAFVLAEFGIELDLSAIAAFFGAGGGATALFAMGKNLGWLSSRG